MVKSQLFSVQMKEAFVNQPIDRRKLLKLAGLGGHEQRRTAMGLELKIVNGGVEEYQDGVYRRSYGSRIEDADTDGHIVAVVTADGRIEEYQDGMCQLSYCSNAKKVRVLGGTRAVTLQDGRVAEFENGLCRRT
jgi:hypothetical protein